MKKILALLLSIALIISMLPITFVSADEVYFEGKGTAEEPYLIQTPEDLAKLVYLTNENYQDKGLYSTTAEIIIPDTTTKWEGSGRTGWYASRPGSGSLVRYYKMTADLDMTAKAVSAEKIPTQSFRAALTGTGTSSKTGTDTARQEAITTQFSQTYRSADLKTKE